MILMRFRHGLTGIPPWVSGYVLRFLQWEASRDSRPLVRFHVIGTKEIELRMGSRASHPLTGIETIAAPCDRLQRRTETRDDMLLQSEARGRGPRMSAVGISRDCR